MTRTALACIPIGQDELVVSLDGHGNHDLRLWTLTGDLRFPSKAGITFPRERLDEVIAALNAAKRRAA